MHPSSPALMPQPKNSQNGLTKNLMSYLSQKERHKKHIELIERLKNETQEISEIMISFDITTLFPSTPTKKCMNNFKT